MFSLKDFKETSRKTVHQEKFLSLKVIDYVDPLGQTRKWEVTERTTRSGLFDGIDILAVVFDSEKPELEKQIILVKQYRPPVRNLVIELPAGLIDMNESPEVAAARELHEETGYKGQVVSSSSELCLEPGLTNANTVLVRMDVDLKFNPSPKQKPDEGEFIEVLLIPFSKLFSSLQKFSKEGILIDSKVYTFAYGLHFMNDFK